MLTLVRLSVVTSMAGVGFESDAPERVDNALESVVRALGSVVHTWNRRGALERVVHALESIDGVPESVAHALQSVGDALESAVDDLKSLVDSTGQVCCAKYEEQRLLFCHLFGQMRCEHAVL